MANTHAHIDSMRRKRRTRPAQTCYAWRTMVAIRNTTTRHISSAMQYSARPLFWTFSAFTISLVPSSTCVHAEGQRPHE